LPGITVNGRTALVTGGNRGIGLEVCRQLAQRSLNVVLTARDPSRGTAAAENLARDGLDVRFERLDITDADSVESCRRQLQADRVEVDVLVNNAAIYATTPLLSIGEAALAEAIETNLIGAWRTIRAFVPGMCDRGWGRVVNISTGYAHVADQAPQAGAYGLTKAALNALTRMIAAEAGPTVKVNSMSPGWVATRMGGAGATESPSQGADTAVWLATLPDDGPTDGFFYNREPIEW
jgi:NAD(P)-dependent dehydrogenase (short-subunit alcohol dehydrogenase family)